jgi:hypothetical protein
MMHVKSLRKISLSGVLLSAMAFSVSLPAFAADTDAVATPADTNSAASPSTDTTIAQVIWVKGNVKATQGTSTRVLERRSPIYAHDVLSTDASGSGEIAFTDSSVMTLRSDTEMKIDEYNFKKSGDGGTGKEVMSLVKGGFRTITGVIPKSNPDNYQVNTPVATIGVRGTDYTAYYTNIEGLMAKIDVGRITIKNATGMVELSKDMSKLYALIRLNEEPKILSKEPAVFKAQPSITPVSPSTINTIGASGKGGNGGGRPGGPGGGKGGTRTVTGFCVGLLKDFYKTIDKFFA